MLLINDTFSTFLLMVILALTEITKNDCDQAIGLSLGYQGTQLK